MGNYENSASAPMAEMRRGPDQPQPSHQQIKMVEQTISELTHFMYKHSSGGGLGHHYSQINDAAQRAATQCAIRCIFGIFGFADPTKTPVS